MRAGTTAYRASWCASWTKPSFRTYLLANLQANRTGAMPILYRLA
jgi:hypothetical protein